MQRLSVCLRSSTRSGRIGWHQMSGCVRAVGKSFAVGLGTVAGGGVTRCGRFGGARSARSSGLLSRRTAISTAATGASSQPFSPALTSRVGGTRRAAGIPSMVRGVRGLRAAKCDRRSRNVNASSSPARSRAAKKMARIEALRKLRHAGYDVSKEQAKRLGVLISVVEDQQRGLPHEHVACPHTSALEIAFTRAFFDALPPRSASSPTRAHRPLPIRDREAGQVSSAAVPRLSSESLRATWPNPCPPASSCESITASAFSTSRPGSPSSQV